MLSENIKRKILELLKDENTEFSSAEIQKNLQFNRTTITKYLNILLSEKKIKYRHSGMAKIWSISNASILSFFTEKTIMSEKDNHIKNIFNSIKDIGIAILDKNCRFIWLNNTLSSWIGNIDIIKTQSCCFIQSDYKKYDCIAKKTIKTGQFIKDELKIKLQTGTLLDVDLSSTPIKDKNGNVIGVLQIIKDITDRIKIQEKLKEYTEKLEEKVDERTKKLATLSSISYTTTHLTDLKDILRGVLNDVLHMMYIPVGMIFLKDESNEKLLLTTHHGITKLFQEEYTKIPLSIGEGIIGTIAKTGEAILIKDNSSKHPQVSRMSAKEEELRSFIGVPIKIKNNTLGVLCIASKGDYTFNTSDKDTMISIGEQVGFAVENAHLFEKTNESIEKYKGLLKASPDAVALINLDGKIIEASHILVKMLGFNHSKDLIDQVAFDFIDNTDKEKANKNFELTYRTGAVYGAQYLMTRVNKSKFYAEVNGVIFKDSKGNPKGILITIRDITQKKKIEKEITDTKNYLEAIIRTSKDGIFVVDKDGNFEFGNDAFYDIIGWPKEEIINESFLKVIPKDLHEFMLERWLEVQSGHGTPYETKILTKTGKLKTLAVSHTHTKLNNERKYIVVIHDITEQKVTELKLNKSHEFLQKVINNIDHPILVIKPDHTISLMNDAAQKNSKIKLYQNIKHKCFQVSHDCDKPCSTKSHPCPLEEVKKTKKTIKLIHNHIDADGIKHIIEITASPLWDKNKEFVGIIESNQDITERINAEKIIHESEEKYRNLVELTTDIIYTSNTKGNITYMNDAGYKLLEASPKDIINMPWVNWLHPDDRTKSFEKFNEMIKKDIDVFNYENRFISKTGKIHFMNHNIRVLRNKNSKIIGTQGIARDTTNETISKKQLKETKNYLETVIKMSSDGIFVVDENGLFEFGNDACTEICGWKTEELIGHPFIKLIPKEHQKAILKRWIEAQNNQPQSYETVIITKNGENKHLLVSHKVFEFNGKRKYVNIIKDITRNKKIELQKEFLANIIQNNNNAIISLDLNDIITSWNPAAEKLTGFKKEDVLGKNIIRNIVPNNLITERKELIACASKNKIASINTTRYTKNKTIIPVSLTISPIYDNNNKLIGYSSILKDLSTVKDNKSSR